MRTTVDAVAEFLAVAGIRRMYGVPGAGSSNVRRRGGVAFCAVIQR